MIFTASEMKKNSHPPLHTCVHRYRIRTSAEEMNVTPQDITKIVSGKENLTLETITKLQKALNIVILTTSHSHEKIADIEIIHSF